MRGGPQQPSAPPPWHLRTAAALLRQWPRGTAAAQGGRGNEGSKEMMGGASAATTTGLFTVPSRERITEKVAALEKQEVAVETQDRDRSRSPGRLGRIEAVAKEAWEKAISLHGAWVLTEDAAARAYETSMKMSATAEFAVTAFQSAIAAAKDLGAPTCESARPGLADAIAWPWLGRSNRRRASPRV